MIIFDASIHSFSHSCIDIFSSSLCHLPSDDITGMSSTAFIVRENPCHARYAKDGGRAERENISPLPIIHPNHRHRPSCLSVPLPGQVIASSATFASPVIPRDHRVVVVVAAVGWPPRPRCDSPESPSTCPFRDSELATLYFPITCRRFPVPGLLVHHNLPCVHRQVRVVERPVELLLRHRLVGRVVIRREVFVRESVACSHSCSRVEDEHSLEEVDGCAGIEVSTDSDRLS